MLRGVQEYFVTLQIRHVAIKIDQKRRECSGRMTISQLICCLFLSQYVVFLPTYIANGEIEVWRNTLLHIVHELSI